MTSGLFRGRAFVRRKTFGAVFGAAKGDVLMILDGDLAVIPEELPYFLQVLLSGSEEFINGSMAQADG